MRRTFFLNVDWGLLIPVSVLITLSLTALFSISVTYFKSQLIFLVLSFFVFLFFSNVNYKITKVYALPIYVISVVLLFVILLIGIESHGAIRWIDLFGLRIQFSEILKPFLALAFSSYLANKNLSFLTLFLSTCFLLPIMLLIFMQPDLGNVLIYFTSVVLVFFVLGFPLKWFVVGFLGFLAMVPFGWSILHDYQKQRILTFLYPTKDPLGTSYNSIQSIIAVGSGTFFGKGFNESTQSALRFLPERHTDFIFATLSEGLGFIGAVIIVVAFIFLLYKVFYIASNVDDKYGKVFAVFCFSLIIVQFFINAGMNMGIIPIVGITLPFVSYGGSSLLSNFILFGLLSSVNKTLKDRKVLEIR